MRKKEFRGVQYWIEMEQKWWVAYAGYPLHSPHYELCYTRWGALWKARRVARRIVRVEKFNRDV